MKEYFKFPSTKHIVLPENERIRKDKVMSDEDIAEMLRHELIIEEKVDGANLGISFNDNGDICLQNRGDWLLPPWEGQWEKLKVWIDRRQDSLFNTILDKYILFGEWCYATHSIHYNKLPDYFIGFDLYDKENGHFLSVERRNEMCNVMGITVIHQCARGKYTLKELFSFFGQSYYGDNMCEGIYVRWDDGEWLKRRAKLVRNDFRQSMEEHWSKKSMQINCLNFFSSLENIL